MVAARRDVVSVRKLLDDFDVRREAGASEDALEQVVAEQRRIGHAPGQRGLERIDVIDALASVGALAEQVLIDVGYRRCVRIDAAVAGIDALEQRALMTGRQRRRDARLQDAVTLNDAARLGIEARPVERVRELADQAAHRIARQFGVGIQRDDEPHVARCHRRAAVRRDEAGAGVAAQQPVELVQFAALALPAEPALLADVPHAAAMQQHETVAARQRGIARVELRHPGGRRGQQRVVACDGFGGRICPVGQQREMHIAFETGKVMDLEALDLLGDIGKGGDQHRHGDQGPEFGGNAVA